MNTVDVYILKKDVVGSRMGSVEALPTTITFSGVYRAYKDKIYSYVYYRVDLNADVAEDIVSDIFVKVYEKFDTYDQHHAVSTWLYTIARNTLIDHYRRNRQTGDIDNLSIADETDPLFRLLDENISETEVQAAIARLPEKQRICIVEQFFNGKTGSAIAAERQMTHSAVRQHISRGIAELRRLLLSLAVVLSGSITSILYL